MTENKDAISFSQFDLLPPSFHDMIRVRQVRCSWLLLNCILIATLLGVTAATAVGKRREHEENEKIAAEAIPLIQLRNDVFELQDKVEQRDDWCQLVEASRPDDSALQTLAAVASASQIGTRGVVIDTVHLRLPIEFPESAASPPKWAAPQLAISARVLTDVVEAWINRLNHFDRIENASLTAGQLVGIKESPEEESQFARLESRTVRVTANPIPTRVLP